MRSREGGTVIDLKAKFLGSLVGSALGDAIGELAFRFTARTDLGQAVARASQLRYTDDTAMAIGLAESIGQLGRVDSQHLGDTFRTHFGREPWRGYAQGPPTVFSLVERQGISYADAAGRLFGGEGSFGNGAAMRIAPLGVFFHGSGDLYEQARAAAVVTHAHPIGIDGAAVLAWTVARAVGLDPAEPFPWQRLSSKLVDFARTDVFRKKMTLVQQLLAEPGLSPLEAARQLGRSVAAHESVPFALYAFLRHPHSFEQCLYCAVLNGGDRDTLGAMACAASGAYLGMGAIPETWRKKLENRTMIEGLAARLAEMTGEG
jgi:poly(ADP-ribose) glycohydrolase ARH3